MQTAMKLTEYVEPVLLGYRVAKIQGISSKMYCSGDSIGTHIFIALTSNPDGGITPEGRPFFYHKTSQGAIDAYLLNLKQWLRGYSDYKNGMLYWRAYPTISYDAEFNGFTVYSRLLYGPPGLKNPENYDAQIMNAQAVPEKCHKTEYLQPGWRAALKGPNPENKSGFRATGHRILLIPEVVEKKSTGGIVLVEKTVNAEEQIAVIATVLEIGPDAWSDKSTDYCQVGDRVLIGQYVGKFHTSPIDGKKYRFVADLDIISPILGVEAS